MNDLEIDRGDGNIDSLTMYADDCMLTKYADDCTISVIVPKELHDSSSDILDQFMKWTTDNEMLCNTGKCKELVVRKKGDNAVYPTFYNIKQHSSIPILGIALQNNCKFSQHVKNMLNEANKCFFVI